jgi:hypothetical protein
VPLSVSLPARAVQLSAEANTACAVLESGELYCWGRNWEGNIGLNDQHPGVDQPSPVRSGTASDWLLTGTGDGHTCGIRQPGLLFGWGRNSAANLGLGQTVDEQRRVATPIGTEQDWRSVVSGQDASCGIRSLGLLFCWGGNSYATLGLGDRVQRLSPTQLAAPGGSGAWTEVSLDTFHACAVDADNELYCWGRNLEGQLGTADTDDRLAPELVGVGFSHAAVGRFSSCAVSIDAGARVSCAGENKAWTRAPASRAPARTTQVSSAWATPRAEMPSPKWRFRRVFSLFPRRQKQGRLTAFDGQTSACLRSGARGW